jgi:predicted nucleic acid-binding protein
LYDALLIASAREDGGTRLYSEALQDGQRTDTLVIENPFQK